MSNVMFLKQNILDETATITSDNKIGLYSYLYDRLRSPYLSSDGYADDSSAWTITVELTQESIIDIIIIDGINASGTIEYHNGTNWVYIATIDNSPTFFNMAQSKITTKKIRVSLTDTGNDSEKTISEIVLTSLIGQLEKNPSKVENQLSENSITHKTSSGSVVYVKLGQAFKSKIKLSGASISDISLINSLKNMVYPFILYLCGGVHHDAFGWGIQDYYLVNYINAYEPSLTGNMLDIGQDISIELHEA